MSLFTPIGGIVGGSLIGGSSAVLLLFNGDIMGISGIMTNSLVYPKKSLKESQYHWRWVYLAGFSTAVHVYVHYLAPDSALSDTRSTEKDVPIPSALAHVLGGLLVGLGTRIGNGCTTGHGICGIGRLSLRSLVATATFTGMSIATRFMIAPIRPWADSFRLLRSSELPAVSPLASILVVALTTTAASLSPQTVQSQADLKKKLGAWLSGVMFAAGLAFSGMTKNSKVHDFLCLSGFSKHTYDPTLMFVMGSGILSSWLAYQFIPGRSQIRNDEECMTGPVCNPENGFCDIPSNNKIDLQLLLGAAVFGVGWGTTGICPGPAIYAAAAGIVNAVVAWVPSFCVGAYVGDKIKAELFEKKKVKSG